MRIQPSQDSRFDAEPVTIVCHDAVRLGGHYWRTAEENRLGTVIINPATCVLARYYHRYARFLASHGFDVITYDYRGIGLSRPERLRECDYRWRDWGERDFEAVLRFAGNRGGGCHLIVVGHSIGGFLPGLAQSAYRIDRMLTVGAQYAWWGDYALRRRLPLVLKWHIAMPLLTAILGYFPGRKLGWLEDLPSGVANEWSFRGPRFERSHSRSERQHLLARMASMTAPTLAVAISDDELGTPAAIGRTLDYYVSAERTSVLLQPSDYDCDAIGHFGLFHDSHVNGFWLDTLMWLREGRNPWPNNIIKV